MIKPDDELMNLLHELEAENARLRDHNLRLSEYKPVNAAAGEESALMPVSLLAAVIPRYQHEAEIGELISSRSQEVVPATTSAAPGSALIISLGTDQVDLTIEWLMSVLPPDAAAQVADASLVLVTDPAARLMRVLRCDVKPGDVLVAHVASIG